MAVALNNKLSVEENTAAALQRLREGDDSAFAELFSMHRDRLERIVNFRIDSRLMGRVDAEDILQEAFVDGQNRIENLRNSPTHSFLVWIRVIVGQTMINVHRRHLASEKRNASKEFRSSSGFNSDGSSPMLIQLVDSITSPSQVISKKELFGQVTDALDSLKESDREIVALRHFEELTNSEIAEILEITPKTASIRYVRALERLKTSLANVPGFFED